MLTQMVWLLIHGEPRPIGRQLEQDAVADAEVERLEPEAVDDTGSAQAGAMEMSLPRLLLPGVMQAEGDVMDAAAT